MNNKPIYIFGHKNPDTDSVCGAIALSYLKNQLGFNTIPCVLGNVNSETKYALDYFKVKAPMFLNDVKLQIKDVSYHKDCFIDKNSSIKDAMDYMSKYNLTGLPIVENKNKYYGYVSLKELAREIVNGDYHKINTSYGNLLNVLRGNKVLKYDKEISGRVLAATFGKETFLDKVELDSNSILIVGDRKVILEYAIENKVKLIIVVGNLELSNEILSKARNNKVNIISTPYTAYEVAKLISLSNYIKDMIKYSSVTFNEVDYLSDFMIESKKLKHSNYPIINSKSECTGLLTLTDSADAVKKQVILVDHNNSSQSVDGLDEAEILEVVDHHNIGDINTKNPINFRNSRTGCVNTIIYDLFKENDIEIPPHIAGLMASAIISDTLLLTSPTITIRDTDALINLSRIAKIKYKDYGMDMLKHGMSVKGLSFDNLLHKDYKSFKAGDYSFAIGQVLTSDFDYINKKMKGLVSYLDEVAENEKLKVVTLFITDIFQNLSYVIYNSKAEDIIKESYSLENVYEGVALKNVVSRKMQMVPYIMNTLEKK